MYAPGTQFHVDVQAGNGFEYLAPFTVTVEAESLDSAARRAIRRAVANAQRHNANLDDGDFNRRSERKRDYRVRAVRLADSPSAKPVGARVAEVGTATVYLTIAISGSQVAVVPTRS